MRHLGSIVLSMLLVPIVYVLTGIGLVDWSVAESGSSLDIPSSQAPANAEEDAAVKAFQAMPNTDRC